MLELIFQSQKKMQEMYQYEEEEIVNEFERMSEKKNPTHDDNSFYARQTQDSERPGNIQ